MADRNIDIILEKIKEDESISDSQTQSIQKFAEELDDSNIHKSSHVGVLHRLVSNFLDKDMTLENPTPQQVQRVQNKVDRENKDLHIEFRQLNIWNIFLESIDSDKRIEIRQRTEIGLGEVDG